MGRKLTSSERARRDRERESERIHRARQVAARRAAEHAQRARAQQSQTEADQAEVADYVDFVTSLSRFHTQHASAHKVQAAFKRATPFKPSRPAPIQPQLDFRSDPRLERLTEALSWDLDQYCKHMKQWRLWPFSWFNKTSAKYELFKRDAAAELTALKIAEANRKIDAEARLVSALEAFRVATELYLQEMELEKAAHNALELARLKWFGKAQEGDTQAMAEVCGIAFPMPFSLDEDYAVANPTESSVGYRFPSSNTLHVCVNLPTGIDFLPPTGIKMKPAGRELTEYANNPKRMVEAACSVICSVGLAYAGLAFHLLTPLHSVLLEVGYAGVDPHTGHPQDIVNLQITVVRDKWEKINLENIDPVLAIKNFEHRFVAPDKTKSIPSLIDRQAVEWATDDEKREPEARHIATALLEMLYQ